MQAYVRVWVGLGGWASRIGGGKARNRANYSTCPRRACETIHTTPCVQEPNMKLGVAQQPCPAALLLVHLEMMLAHAPKVMSQPVCPAIDVPKREWPPAYLAHDHGRATALVRGQPLVLHGLLEAHIANLARHTLLFMTMGHAARHQSATAALAVCIHATSPLPCHVPGQHCTWHDPGSLSMQTVPTLSWDRGRPSAGTALKTCASGEPAER